MQNGSETGSLRGIVAFFLFALGTIFVAPLEAVLGLALCWLVGGSEAPDASTGE